jgi:ribonucleoside-diphosphate reductase alpha chain
LNGELIDELGFKDEEMDAANDYVCGTMMLEGAPGLKEEHLPCVLTVPINAEKR